MPGGIGLSRRRRPVHLGDVRPSLPAPLHRLALRIAHRIRLIWWSWRKPEIHGCNVVVRNPASEVLLVRHSYQAPGRWMLPGGGLRRGERPVDAAPREVREETGCELRDCIEFGLEVADLRGARHHIHLIAAMTGDMPTPDGREVVEARFFATEALPDATTATARSRIERWLHSSHQNSAS